MWESEFQEVLLQIRKLEDESGRIQGRGEILVAVFCNNWNPGFLLAEKLKPLKGKMKEWSKNNRKKCKAQKEEIMEELAKWEAVPEQRVLTEE